MSCGDIAIFYFQYGGRTHLEFLKYANFHFLRGLQWQFACSCKILSLSVERLRRYYKLNIFNMAAVRHLGFVIACARPPTRPYWWSEEALKISSQICKFYHSARFTVKMCLFDKISSRSVERLRRYCEFSISNMAAVRHLKFVKYANFSTFPTVCR